MPVEGALSPINCAKESAPCSTLQGIHKLDARMIDHSLALKSDCFPNNLNSL